MNSDEGENWKDPWKMLRGEVKDALDSSLKVTNGTLPENTCVGRDGQSQCSASSLPKTVKKKVFALHQVVSRPTRHQVIKTLHRFMGEDDMRFEEALDVVVEQLRLLLDSFF